MTYYEADDGNSYMSGYRMLIDPEKNKSLYDIYAIT